MAEMGHPVIGPTSFWKLTPAEIRIYAEGAIQQNDRQAEQQSDTTDPKYERRHQESTREREDEAVQEIQQQVQAQG